MGVVQERYPSFLLVTTDFMWVASSNRSKLVPKMKYRKFSRVCDLRSVACYIDIMPIIMIYYLNNLDYKDKVPIFFPEEVPQASQECNFEWWHFALGFHSQASW